ncbi:MAG: cohesin domain-containing protein [Eubacteriales bacterium]
MRKFWIPFVGILLLIFLLPLTANGQEGSVTVSVDEIRTPVPGADFTVDVEIGGNSGFTLMDLSVEYNSDDMTLCSVNFASFLTDSGVECSSKNGNISICSDQPLTRNGVYFSLTFTLSKSAGLGEYPISLRLGTAGIQGTNGDMLKVTLEAGGVDLDCLHQYHVSVTEPTCSSEGYTEYRCSECSITYISDYVSKTPHTWKTLSSTEATCTKAATQTRQCKVCGETETVSKGEPLGHDYVEQVIEATCYREGYTDHTCSRCGDSYKDEITPVTNHQYSLTYRKAATCAETGFDLYSCIFCGVSYQQTTPTLEHTWTVTVEEPTHDHGGWSLYTCSECGLSMRGDFTDPLPHEYDYQIEKEATCSESGYRIGICNDGCGHTVREEIPPLGHDYGEWTQIREATFFDEGLWEASCTRCGYTVQSATPKLESLSSDPPVQSMSFWEQVADRILQSTAALVMVSAGFLLLVFLIFLHFMRRAVRRRRYESSVRELEELADLCEDFVPPALPSDFNEHFDRSDDPDPPSGQGIR